ncbi:hypothetical protein L218DRAFT_947608 [Marasmius fiardii PR-910]|nr:hypothetical protein L218DRAFT_947608 [Marasmius fiardii PR-910]
MGTDTHPSTDHNKMKTFIALAILLPFNLSAPQSDEMVTTPGGLRPRSGVIQIPEGGSINLTPTEIHLLDVSNKIIHVAPRSEARLFSPHTTTPALKTGWISWARWTRTGSPIQKFTTIWTVPSNPPADDAQVIYLFNALC